MLLFVELTFIALALLFWWYKNDRQQYSSSPPGPTRLPVVGNLIQIMTQSSFPATALKKLADIYGDVMFLKMGGAETVVFTSPSAIREMLVHDKTANRALFESIRDRHNDKNLGIIWGNGGSWQNLRRFTMRNLREFGFGKSAVMDVVVHEEITKFMNHLKIQVNQAPNQTIFVQDLFSLTMLNVLWRLVSGKPYDYNDPKILRLLKLNDEFFRSTNFGVDISQVFPILRDLFPDWSGRKLQRQTSKEMYDYGKELLQEQRQQGNYKDPQSFIDVFTAKVETSKEDPQTDFSDEQFVMTILDLIVGGSETSSNTLNFGMLYMILNPHVQEKVHKEIDRVVPPDVPIDTTMKPKLPYTTATVFEILRCSTVIPLPAAREATEDFQFRKYFIKKGTTLFFNMYGVNHDEAVWGDPENFRPERFLTPDGTKIEQSVFDKLQVFGAGRRFCLGQSLAEVTMFLYFASFMRKLKLEKVPGTNPSPKPVLGITSVPAPFSMRIIKRTTAAP